MDREHMIAVRPSNMKELQAKGRADKKHLLETEYRLQYNEEPLWLSLAEEKGVKLPRHNVPTYSAPIKFARSIGLEDGTWEAGFFGADYSNSVRNAINKQQERLGTGNKETIRALCGYLLEANK